MIISMQRIKDFNWFFPVLSLIKESFNLIGWKTQKAIPNQKWQFQALLSFDGYLYAKKNNKKNNKKKLNSFDFFYRHFDQRILESDWMKGRNGHAQPN